MYAKGADIRTEDENNREVFIKHETDFYNFMLIIVDRCNNICVLH